MAHVTKTLLITGATGSIGRKLRKHFAGSAFELRLLCINPGNDPSVMTADLSRYDDSWAAAFKGADVVIHLAGASAPISSWETVERLNIDLSLNVLRAADAAGVRKLIFASSNWVMAGHRFGSSGEITTKLPPWPINPYGAGKLFIERAGLALAARSGLSFIAFRIGYCQHAEGNIPGPHMDHGVWGQQMWLSDRDLCQGMERGVMADIPSAILNLMSVNPGMRWDIEETRRLIGYRPVDGHVAVSNPQLGENEAVARREWAPLLHPERVPLKF